MRENRPANSTVRTPYARLVPFEKGGEELNAVVETPKGNRNKYKYEPDRGLFTLHKVLPAGAIFPFDFGYIPGTAGQDGDPLDVLILMDEPAFTGCLVSIRLVGVIEAEEVEQDGRAVENDRLIAVASNSVDHKETRSLKEVSPELIEEIEHFFISYNQMENKEFHPKGKHGPRRAHKLVTAGQSAFRKRARRSNGK